MFQGNLELIINNSATQIDEAKRNEAQSIIEEYKEDGNFLEALLGLLLNQEIVLNTKFLAACVMNTFSIHLPPGWLPNLFPLLSIDCNAFVISLAKYISSEIKEEEISVLMNCTEESLKGVLCTLVIIVTNHYSKGVIPVQIIEFCAAIMEQSEEIWTKTMAAYILSKLEEAPEELIAKAVEFFKMPVDNENYPFFTELFELFEQVDNSQEIIEIVVQKLNEISEFVPFDKPIPSPNGDIYSMETLACKLVNFLSNVCLYNDDCYSNEEEEVNYDPFKLELLPLMMKLSVLSNADREAYISDHEEFLKYSCYASGELIEGTSLRKECANFFDTPKDFEKAAFTLISKEPDLMEPVFYAFGYHLFPTECIGRDIEFPDFEISDELALCNFIPLFARNGQMEVEKLAELLQSGDFNITLMAARALLLNEKYDECIPIALEAVYSLLEAIETSNVIILIEIINSLTQRIEFNEEYTGHLLKQVVGLFDKFWSDYYVQSNVLDIVHSLTLRKENFPLLFEALLPVFEGYANNEQTRIVAVELFGVLFEQLPTEDVEVPDVSGYFPFFQEFYAQFDPTIILEINDSEDIYSDNNYLFYPIAFFARMGLTEGIDEKFMEIFHFLEIEKEQRLQFGTVLVPLLINSPNKVEIAGQLIEILKETGEGEPMSNTSINTIALIESCFGFLVTVNIEETVGILQSIEGAIELLIEAAAGRVQYINGRFDFFLILALLFAICEDKTLPYETLSSYIEGLVFTFCNGELMTDVIQTYRFDTLDPLYIGHAFSNCTLYRFFHFDFVLNEEAPEFVREFIENKKICFGENYDSPIPFLYRQ